MKFSGRLQNIIIPISIVLLAGTVRMYGIGWGLPNVYEEARLLKEAWQMWGWGPEKTLDFNPHFFNYPSLIIYIHYVAQVLLYLSMKLWGSINSTLEFQVLYALHKTPFILTGRMISALFGTASVAMIYFIGRKVGDTKVAVPSALFLCLNVFHITRSQMIEVDVPLTFFTLVTIYYSLRLLDAPTLRNYLLAGAALGLAISTKYTGVILVLPMFAAHILARKASRPPAAASVPRHDSTLVRQSGHWRYLAFAFILAVSLFFVTSPFVFLDAKHSLKDILFERGHMRYGYFGMEAYPTWLFYQRSLMGKLLGWPIVIMAIIGLVYLTVFRRRRWAIIIAALVIPYTITVASWSMRADRYLLPIIPLVILIAFAVLAEFIELERIKRLKYSVRLLLASLVILVMATALVSRFPGYLNDLKPNSRTEARKWIEENVPSGSFLLLESYGPELLEPSDIMAMQPEVKKAVLSQTKGKPRYAVIKLPMYQVDPQFSSVFYDLSFFSFVDFVVTSSSVESRYLKEPERFASQVTFYDSLNATFQKLQTFPAQGRQSATVTIYKNPINKVPFAARSGIHAPPPLKQGIEASKGAKAKFCCRLGLNFEIFKHFQPAIDIYTRAFNYSIDPPYWYRNLAFRTAKCLMLLGRIDDANAFLEEVEAKAPNENIGNSIREVRHNIEAHLRQLD